MKSPISSTSSIPSSNGHRQRSTTDYRLRKQTIREARVSEAFARDERAFKRSLAHRYLPPDSPRQHILPSRQYKDIHERALARDHHRREYYHFRRAIPGRHNAELVNTTFVHVLVITLAAFLLGFVHHNLSSACSLSWLFFLLSSLCFGVVPPPTWHTKRGQAAYPNRSRGPDAGQQYTKSAIVAKIDRARHQRSDQSDSCKPNQRYRAPQKHRAKDCSSASRDAGSALPVSRDPPEYDSDRLQLSVSTVLGHTTATWCDDASRNCFLRGGGRGPGHACPARGPALFGGAASEDPAITKKRKSNANENTRGRKKIVCSDGTGTEHVIQRARVDETLDDVPAHELPSLYTRQCPDRLTPFRKMIKDSKTVVEFPKLLYTPEEVDTPRTVYREIGPVMPLQNAPIFDNRDFRATVKKMMVLRPDSNNEWREAAAWHVQARNANDRSSKPLDLYRYTPSSARTPLDSGQEGVLDVNLCPTREEADRLAEHCCQLLNRFPGPLQEYDWDKVTGGSGQIFTRRMIEILALGCWRHGFDYNDIFHAFRPSSAQARWFNLVPKLTMNETRASASTVLKVPIISLGQTAPDLISLTINHDKLDYDSIIKDLRDPPQTWIRLKGASSKWSSSMTEPNAGALQKIINHVLCESRSRSSETYRSC